MDEEEIREMKKEAKKALKRLEEETDEKWKRFIINSFKAQWWGIRPDEAMKLYPDIK